MQHLRTTLLLLACSPLVVGFEARETRIRFDVKADTELEKTFTSRVELELDEMRVLRNGEEPDGLPELEMQVSTDLEVSVRDHYVAMREGAPSELRRTFETIHVDTEVAMEMDLQGQTHNQETPVSAGSELEGETVRFLWNEEEQRYVRSFVESEADEDLLDDLVEDMDLRAFLPDREVAVGDEWDVAPHEIASVMAPGGDLKLVPEKLAYDMSTMSGQMGELSDWFDENLKGEVRCRLTDLEQDGDRRFAIVTVTIDLENQVDMTEMAQEELANVDLPPGSGEIEVEHMRTTLAIEGEGTLRWDLGGGHFHSLDITSDFRMQMDIGVTIEPPGFGEVSTQQQFDMSGALTFGAKIQ